MTKLQYHFVKLLYFSLAIIRTLLCIHSIILTESQKIAPNTIIILLEKVASNQNKQADSLLLPLRNAAN